ncbi:MAG: GNAT family N-acetyltransferase [Planctomycetes bacterium]|nr:GNAT family N-acetyltransferase [Planctomycetota bacterium]
MISLRSAGAADDPARDELHARCFGFAPPRGMWSWKYRENPHGSAIERVLAQDGAIVAAFGLQPRLLACPGGELLAFQAADAMTAPEAQRRGYFARLLASAEEEARLRGGALLCAFGGARSNASFARAGWRELCRTQGVRALLRGPRAWWRRRAPRAALEAVSPERAAEAFAAVARATRRVSAQRDASWLAWRTRCPRYRGFVAPSGAAAFAEICGERGVVADLAPADAWQREPELWRGLCVALRAQGVAQVELTLVEGEPLAACAARVGWVAPRRAEARPFWWKPLRDGLSEQALGGAVPWIRDLDRDAEGLLLRAAATSGSAA